ncbi:aldo-keto reductase AKR2E4-like isoform X2 [Aricia agestis]|uniref:aldo-keto reductase AKR2E4-like isoform X2 n=1 Tax=Aricia agestis TaxID=91739 RepID=UPI001C2062E9|nr:aldo-keto reductase AKR2E4-like isoform X2 [Aricia agestis]
MEVAYIVFILSFNIKYAYSATDTSVYLLNDGHKIPTVALGTSLGHLSDGTRVLPVNHSLARAVQWALEAGYRHIDTAALYRVEDEVGLGVQHYIEDNNATREDVYITTKLWNDAHDIDEVIPALKKSLDDLKMDYVDLYLMHYPMAYSVNPSITQVELVDWCKEHGVVVMAYSPFGGILGRKKDAPPPHADDPTLVGLAKKYNKTVPQILLRYLLDRQLVAIPRSTNKDRIKENIDIMNFSLTPDEVENLSKFNSDYRLRTPVKWYSHPEFPFEKKNLSDAEIKYIIEHSKED